LLYYPFIAFIWTVYASEQVSNETEPHHFTGLYANITFWF